MGYFVCLECYKAPATKAVKISGETYELCLPCLNKIKAVK
jgi:hypothetical protein